MLFKCVGIFLWIILVEKIKNIFLNEKLLDTKVYTDI